MKKEYQEYELYLAIPAFAFDTFFQRPLIQEIVSVERINLLIFDPINETIITWKNF